MIRSVVGVLAGLVMAGAVIAFGEAITHLFLRANGHLDSAQSFGAAVANASLWALVGVLVAWALGTFVGAGVAALVARHGRLACALIVGCAVMAAALLDMLTIPHPIWFWAAALALVVPTSWIAGRLVSPSAVR